MIASASDFVHGVSIPNRTEPAILESIDWYIAKYEPIFLRKLLGADLAILLSIGLALEPPAPVLVTLRDQLKNALLNYIYYNYRKFNASNFNGTDETVGKYENSEAISPADKMRRIWNEMIDLNYNVITWLNLNIISYPYFIGVRSDFVLFCKINEMGL